MAKLPDFVNHAAGWIFGSALFFLACTFTGCKIDYNEKIDTVAISVQKVSGNVEVAHQYYRHKVVAKTEALYEANRAAKQWLLKKGPHPRFKAFLAEAKESYRYGMNPDDYDIKTLEKEVEDLYKNRKRSDAEASELDVRITASFFLFTTHLLEGRIRTPGARDYIWKRGMPHEDDVSLLLANDSKKELKEELDALHPTDKRYRDLQHALDQYRALESTIFKAIPENVVIKPGDTSAHVALVKRRLMLTDLKIEKPGADSTIYDVALLDAVKQFQRRHGLAPHGIVNKEVITYLNIPFQNLAEVIALNLERLRWQPHLPDGDEFILVNVPEYMLRVYKAGKPALQMRVVLGSEFNATPIFADTIKHIVFSPTWNVPQSILEEEFLPKLKSDPSHFNRDFTFYKKGKEIDPEEEEWDDKELDIRIYEAVQKPGESNSLGHVKFVMPNNYKIYLHDTPADQLFKEQERAFSHGCIRLEKPLELANYLLRDKKDWNKKAIVKAMQLEEPKTVKLEKEYPVHIVYHTAWVDENGLVNFRKDIYGHDERQLAQLNKNGSLLGYGSGN